jgi:hypothetical protein
MYLYAPLSDALAQLEKTSLLLTPHLRGPVRKERGKVESIVLKCGVFNAGFLGVRATDEGLRFVNWWKDRLVAHCFNFYQGTLVDQAWLNFIPLFFEEYEISRDPTINFGYWSMAEHDIQRLGGNKFAIDGKPLKLGHLSGFDFRRDDLAIRVPIFTSEDNASAFLSLVKEYQEVFKAKALWETQAPPYRFGYFASGKTISSLNRRNGYVFFTKNPTAEVDPFSREMETIVEPNAFIKELLLPARRLFSYARGTS